MRRLGQDGFGVKDFWQFLRDQTIEAIKQCPTGHRPPPTRQRIATMTQRSEILDEGFQICATDCRAVKDMQACGVRNV
jgi:hypothetical protein